MAKLISVKSYDKGYHDLDPNGNLQNETQDMEGVVNEAFIDNTSSETPPPYGGSAVIDVFSAQVKKADNLKMNPTFTSNRKEYAIQVNQARKSYVSGGKSTRILQDLNMTVKKGTIYSLLGSSGCGKTTLLTCVVGVKNLDSGEILINGVKAGTPGSGVPGNNIGYMPQDIALYDAFSIKETLHYFGSLNGMKSSEIHDRGQFLINLLKVPEETRRVGSLSGGQKRRVSVAVSIIHSPPLIILDEPTVGVDPLLRESIWRHLTELVSGGKSTVIITTHYIDEAGESDCVGVMRNGRLLTEKSPSELYEEFSTSSLNDVVLKLCYNDDVTPVVSNPRSKSSGSTSIKQLLRRISSTSLKSQNTDIPVNSNSFARVRSLIRKNIVVLTRNLLLLVFAILTPATQCLMLGFAVGNDPKPIAVGVINNELNGSACNPLAVKELPPCIIANLSCKYLDLFPKDRVLFTNYDTLEEARADIGSGLLQSVMSFPAGFSDYIYDKASRGIMVDNATIEGSTITLEMDASNAVITGAIRKVIYDSYQDFVKTLLSDCGFDPQLGGLPIKFENPIYGRYDLEFREYICVGVVIAFAFFFPVCTSSVAYIWDKKQGTMERARVSGTQTWEIILSYFVTEGLIVIFQVVGLFLILHLVFGVETVGSLPLSFSIVVLTGFSGISLGLLFGAICYEEIQAVLLTMAVIIPTIFLTGPIWPLSGMPSIIQHIAYLMPGTLSSEAFRAIVMKGWGFSHFHVWTGFVSLFGWICFYWIANIWIHRYSLAKQ